MQRHEVEHEVRRLYDAQLALGEKKNYGYFAGLWRWLDYLKDGVYLYLNVYSFFPCQRTYPAGR